MGSFRAWSRHHAGRLYIGQMMSVTEVQEPPDSYCMGRRGSRVRSQEAIASWLGPKPVGRGWGEGCVCGGGGVVVSE